MQIYYDGSNGREMMTIDKPADFYPVVSEKIAKNERGKELQVTAGIDDMHYAIFDVSVRSGTQNTVLVLDTLDSEFMPDQSDEHEVYLGCIDPEKNAYKYYIMYPPKNGKMKVDYGRCALGEDERFGKRSCTWDAKMYPVKLQEKLKKGYVDLSEYMLAEDNTSEKKDKNAPLTPSRELYGFLHENAVSYTKRNVNVPVNKTVIAKAEELIQQLQIDASTGDVDTFNETLKLLLLVLQRKIKCGDGMGVNRMLAHTQSDFSRIILRESSLCEAMKGALVKTGSHVKGDFSDYGVEVYDASPDQIDFVMRHMDPSMQPIVKHVWRTIPKEPKDRFEQYVEENNIDIIKCYWHGSKNECMASIVENGPKLDVSGLSTVKGTPVQETGKMFGNGIYTAKSSTKSFGYTSYHGSRWARGNDDVAYLCLFATAYGNPLNITSCIGDYESRVKNGGYNCLHCHAKQGFLYNDEIVFYDERALLLLYVVQLG